MNKYWFALGMLVDVVAMVGLVLIAIIVINPWIKAVCACMAGLVVLDMINGIEIKFGDVFSPSYWINKRNNKR
jgi:hypothetical protein